MATQSIPTAFGYRKVNDEWTGEFLAFISTLETGRGAELSYTEKDAFWMMWLHGGGSSSGSGHLILGTAGNNLILA